MINKVFIPVIRVIKSGMCSAGSCLEATVPQDVDGA